LKNFEKTKARNAKTKLKTKVVKVNSKWKANLEMKLIKTKNKNVEK
jgi:hypothetical protein